MRDDECLYAFEFTHKTDVQDNTDIVRSIESALSFNHFPEQKPVDSWVRFVSGDQID